MKKTTVKAPPTVAIRNLDSLLLRKKPRSLKCPETLLVRGVRFLFESPPFYWSENQNHELFCDKCGRNLVPSFPYRHSPGATDKNPRWWNPDAFSCRCIKVTLREFPIKHRQPKRDPRQLEIPNLNPEP